jgi:porphobilinogen synthase
MIKAKYPDCIVCTDVALDPYSDQGHDGIVKDGKIVNDETVGQLCKQAVAQVITKTTHLMEGSRIYGSYKTS